MIEADAIAALTSISNPTRLRILRMLVSAGGDGLSAGIIASSLEASPSRTSFHLSNMAEAGLVVATRQSRQIRYRINAEGIGALVKYLIEDCCSNDPKIRGCCGW